MRETLTNKWAIIGLAASAGVGLLAIVFVDALVLLVTLVTLVLVNSAVIGAIHRSIPTRIRITDRSRVEAAAGEEWCVVIGPKEHKKGMAPLVDQVWLYDTMGERSEADDPRVVDSEIHVTWLSPHRDDFAAVEVFVK